MGQTNFSWEKVANPLTISDEGKVVTHNSASVFSLVISK